MDLRCEELQKTRHQQKTTLFFVDLRDADLQSQKRNQ